MPAFVRLEDGAEVRDRHRMAIHRALAGRPRGPAEVRRELVAVELEIDPVLRAAAFAATQQADVEVPRGGDVGDRKGVVECPHLDLSRN